MKTLAEQVGEEVMGYTMKWADGSDWNEPAPETGWRVLLAEDDGLRFEWAPDTNVNDWWELVEKMGEMDWRWAGSERWSRAEADFTGAGGAFYRAHGATLFEATCNAALAVARDE